MPPAPAALYETKLPAADTAMQAALRAELHGLQGAQGVQGLQGVQAVQGAQGAQGVQACLPQAMQAWRLQAGR